MTLKFDQLNKKITQLLKLNVTKFLTKDLNESIKKLFDKTYTNDFTMKKIQNAKKKIENFQTRFFLKKSKY